MYEQQVHSEQHDLMKKLDIQDGEFLCDKCEGIGTIPYESSGYVQSQNASWEVAVVCPKCQGDKKVDWVSNITGKPQRYFPGDSSAGISFQISTVLTMKPVKKSNNQRTYSHGCMNKLKEQMIINTNKGV